MRLCAPRHSVATAANDAELSAPAHLGLSASTGLVCQRLLLVTGVSLFLMTLKDASDLRFGSKCDCEVDQGEIFRDVKDSGHERCLRNLADLKVEQDNLSEGIAAEVQFFEQVLYVELLAQPMST